jgi:hypothetical protein
MVETPPSGHPRSSLPDLSPSAFAAAGLSGTDELSQGLLASAMTDRKGPASWPFVLLVGLELAFVFGLLVLTKLSPPEVLKVAGTTTAISVAGFFGRSAVIVVWHRITGVSK